MSAVARQRLPAMAVLLVTVVAASVAPSPRVALAQQGAAAAGDGVIGAGVGGYDVWDWIGLGLRLGVVLLVIWGAVVAMRWYLRRAGGVGAGGGGRQLQVLETRALGPNRALHLVRLGSRAVLLGVTRERINQLLEIEDPGEVERLTMAAAGGEDRPRSLSALVGGLGDRIAGLRAARPSGAKLTQQPRPAEGQREARIAELRRAIGRARQDVS